MSLDDALRAFLNEGDIIQVELNGRMTFIGKYHGRSTENGFGWRDGYLRITT